MRVLKDIELSTEKQHNNLAFKIPDRTNYFLLVDRFYDIILGDEEIFDFRTSFNNLQNISLSNVVIVVHAHHTKVYFYLTVASGRQLEIHAVLPSRHNNNKK